MVRITYGFSLAQFTIHSGNSAVIVRDSFVVLKHYDQKQLGEERFFLVFIYGEKLRQDLKMVRDMEAGADAEAMEAAACCFA